MRTTSYSLRHAPYYENTMGIIARRRKKYRRLFERLEAVLKSNKVTGFRFFKDTNLLNYLACMPFNHLLHSWKLTKVNIFLSDEERAFVDFILTYKKILKRRPNLLLDAPTVHDFYDSPPIGWKKNLRYEDEMEQYRLKLDKYQHEKKMLEVRREALWRSQESEVFRYVEKEDRSAICSKCTGSGIAQPENGAPPPPGGECSWCNGTGSTGYTPHVSPDQREIAEEFRAKIDELQDPVFASFPVKKKPVFIRLTNEGQIFIKLVKK